MPNRTLSAIIVTRNEEMFLPKCIELINPYVDEIIVVNHGGEINIEANDKIKIFHYPYGEPVDMGAVRTFAFQQATCDWIWQVDADEYYPKESCELIKESIQNTEAISFRVPYYNLAWRDGHVQDNLNHYPDRLYRRDVVKYWKGILPTDMTYVKDEFTVAKNKPRGEIGILEYDNMEDKSFENPVQPIIQAPFYHLARTRGRNYEYEKWLKYNRFMHPGTEESQLAYSTRINQWVSGLYDIKKIEVPNYIPTQNIPNPKVSIIIPNFQYANYIGEAIESCLNQTVKPYEIIVVDDGSHDNSVEVIKKYPVTLFEQTNAGVATARNYGATMSTGDYMLFLDADDKLDPTYLEETLKEMKGDVQIVYTDLEFFDQQTGIHNYPDFSSQALKEWQIIPSACALMDRHLLDLSGGFDHTVIYEDWEWWLKLDKLGFNFKHVAKPLFKYRKHGWSRINDLDLRQEKGFNELREKYQITRQPDTK